MLPWDNLIFPNLYLTLCPFSWSCSFTNKFHIVWSSYNKKETGREKERGFNFLINARKRDFLKIILKNYTKKHIFMYLYMTYKKSDKLFLCGTIEEKLNLTTIPNGTLLYNHVMLKIKRTDIMWSFNYSHISLVSQRQINYSNNRLQIRLDRKRGRLRYPSTFTTACKI